MPGLHGGQRLVELGIDQKHGGPGVVDDVSDLLGSQPEVGGHDDAVEAAHAEESDQGPRGIGTDDRDPLPVAHAHPVEREGHPAGARLELGVGERAQRAEDVRLVDHRHAVTVDVGRAFEVIPDVQGHTHGQDLRSGGDRLAA
jgi:hypothetical protein